MHKAAPPREAETAHLCLFHVRFEGICVQPAVLQDIIDGLQSFVDEHGLDVAFPPS